MTIAVCIPTYNQARFLRLAVESALAQHGCEVEVWVSDDASTDHTAAVMERYQCDSRVHYHRQAANQGVAANGSWVLSQPKTPWIVRLDSDDFLEPDYIHTLIEAVEAYPRAGVAHAAVREVDEQGHFRRIRRLRRPSGYQAADDALCEAGFGYKVAANICLFRREALQQTGYYRAGTNFVEDWDLWARIADNGWGNVYVDTVLSNYRVWSDSAGCRKGRKATELEGINRIFDDSLLPAFQRRHWNQQTVLKAKIAIAQGQARALRHVPRDSQDYHKITEQLLLLGDSWGLRWRMRLVRLGFGWVLDGYAHAHVWLRDLAKAALARFKWEKKKAES